MFHSKYFTDRVILQQLCDDEYQTPLSEHGWKKLHKLGPCFMSLATRIMEGATLEEALMGESEMDLELTKFLLKEENKRVLLDAMRVIAESYLARGLAKTEKAKHAKVQVPQIILQSEKGKCYKPVKFIARGSAGAVYTAIRVQSEDSSKLGDLVSNLRGVVSGGKNKLIAAVTTQLQRQLVLKQIEPTQRSSAINEFRIASKLALNDETDRCVTYLDRVDEDPEHLWLLLRRVTPSPYGVDLAQYIESKFFQMVLPNQHEQSQKIIMDLLLGMETVEKSTVCMRDVKPDNVLIEEEVSLEGKVSYTARWSDFGLAVDVGDDLDGSGLRHPKLTENTTELKDSLVGFWYDTQKLVPKPKWHGRRPPERCYQDPNTCPVSSYDMYMFGILVVSMALGIDIPHIDQAAIRKEFELIIRDQLPNDYLTTMELGSYLTKHKAAIEPYFKSTFGDKFGAQLILEAQSMLATDPQERPTPSACIIRLRHSQL